MDAATSPSPILARPDALADPSWWRSAVIYQVYPRSFADGNDDGLGDIAGIRARLGYIRDLGVDAIWISPWYPSPMADAGYDVADFRGIDPAFGTLEDATELVREAHEHGLRVILDIVPNHTSDQHAWFQAALAAGPGSPERARYMFRPGRGEAGEQPPTDWLSVFGGPAWTRAIEADGGPGEWYLHLFAPEQPDLDWTNPEVHAEFESILRFWFDLGVDGFRIDVAHGLSKDPALPDIGVDPEEILAPAATPDHPHWDRDDVHDVYRRWRAIADSYEPPRVFVAEAWVTGWDRLARYLRPDELHTAFNFDFLRAPWRADWLRRVVDESVAGAATVGAPPTRVLSNDDVVRQVSRYARTQGDRPQHSLSDFAADTGTPDLELGTRRARAAALLMLALPGGAYVYQGEELGLWEVEDLPDDLRQDPTWVRSGNTELGRDGCRVPLPWSGAEPPFGFGDGSQEPWLPQPAGWASLTAEEQAREPGSMLALYRAALRIRRDHPALGDGTLRWLADEGDVLAFERQPGFACVVNFGAQDAAVPAGWRVLLASRELTEQGTLPADTAAWLEPAAS